jgi:hypothetical protein
VGVGLKADWSRVMAMKALIGFVFCLACAVGLAQEPAAPKPIFGSIRPEATIVVKKHNMGADLVEVTVLNEKVTEASLTEQINQLGVMLNSAPRGLSVFKTGSGVGGSFLKAQFGIDGLIVDKLDRYNLIPLIRAFAFGAVPIKSFSLIYDGERTTQYTIARYKAPSDAFMLEARSSDRPLGIEYRISVKTTDPGLILLPEKGQNGEVKRVIEPKSGMDPVLIGVIVIRAIAMGLLVYSLASRPRKRASR